MPDYYIGLLSGTSVDSIDAALVDFSTNPARLIACLNTPWPADIREAIFASRQLADNKLDTLHQLDQDTGTVFADAVIRLLEKSGVNASEIKAIGSHGQTIRHRPNAHPPFSLQIGNATRIAQQTGITVVADFRRADIEAGGQGAPLVPAFHYDAFHSNKKNRVVVNIGGIANMTVLPKHNPQQITGFDTGPGNGLMDAWIKQCQQQNFDANGHYAASGKTDARLLATLLMDDYFHFAPPKSTGFEHFNPDWLNTCLNKVPNDNRTDADIQSTLCDLTATSIIRAINQYASNTGEIFICGGGIHNNELIRRLQAMTALPVASTESLGIDPDWVEAITFAWLAKRKLENMPGNIPAVTGASRALILGELTLARTTASMPTNRHGSTGTTVKTD